MTVVETPSGRVRGRRLAPDDGRAAPVDEFLGIRYATPPVGRLRFRRPEPAAPWAGELDASEFAPRAIQPASMLAGEEPEDEDCLALNVWTPDPGASLPVMVWFHGGSFTTGSSSIELYQGARLAGRGVVVVTVNYRLGALGFLDLASIGGEEWAGSSNLGLADQALALTWVRDHIGAFGGDAGNVTIFGESAGAMSVAAHLARPESAGLFHRAIIQSGATAHVQPVSSSEAVARDAVARLGIAHTELERLLDVPAEAFGPLTNDLTAAVRRSDLPLPFRPTFGGADLPVEPVVALAAGAAAHIPILTGTTRDEMNLFRLMALLTGGAGEVDDARFERRVARSVEARGSSRTPAEVIASYRERFPGRSNSELLTALSTDLTFRLPMIEMVDAQAAAGGEARTYLFTHASTAFDGALGAAHAIEIPFVFDNLHRRGAHMLLGDIDEPRRSFAAALADTWVDHACAREVTVPGASAPWPVHDPDDHAGVVLDLACEVVREPDAVLRELWLT
ncbi:MAG: carboxylesterase family protein [Acidimicrobiales bacterium]